MLTNFVKIKKFLRVMRAAQRHQAGHMRPAGRVFETTGVRGVTVIVVLRAGLYIIISKKS
jgi:hypothetical protein